VSIEEAGHLYIETRSFDAAVAFWEALGFSLAAEWRDAGHRAGRLQASGTHIILVEDETPEVTVHFHVRDADSLADRLRQDPAVNVVAPLEPTHWGTRWMHVQDPDGHIFVVEERTTITVDATDPRAQVVVYDVDPEGKHVNERPIRRDQGPPY
jgi:uncharacterized glyoxalase superfamily protein PhnB